MRKVESPMSFFMFENIVDAPVEEKTLQMIYTPFYSNHESDTSIDIPDNYTFPILSPPSRDNMISMDHEDSYGPLRKIRKSDHGHINLGPLTPSTDSGSELSRISYSAKKLRKQINPENSYFDSKDLTAFKKNIHKNLFALTGKKFIEEKGNEPDVERVFAELIHKNGKPNINVTSRTAVMRLLWWITPQLLDMKLSPSRVYAVIKAFRDYLLEVLRGPEFFEIIRDSSLSLKNKLIALKCQQFLLRDFELNDALSCSLKSEKNKMADEIEKDCVLQLESICRDLHAQNFQGELASLENTYQLAFEIIQELRKDEAETDFELFFSKKEQLDMIMSHISETIPYFPKIKIDSLVLKYAHISPKIGSGALSYKKFTS